MGTVIRLGSVRGCPSVVVRVEVSFQPLLRLLQVSTVDTVARDKVEA